MYQWPKEKKNEEKGKRKLSVTMASWENLTSEPECYLRDETFGGEEGEGRGRTVGSGKRTLAVYKKETEQRTERCPASGALMCVENTVPLANGVCLD